MSRRGALAGVGVLGVGLLSAGAKKLMTAPAAAEPTVSPALAAFRTPAGSAVPGPGATPTPYGAISPAATGTPSAAAGLEATAAPTPSLTPTPVATRSMPVHAAATPTPSSTGTQRASRTAGPAFASGVSCIGAANGEFGRWRGREADVASTWGRDGETYVVDIEFKSWKGSLDYAPQYDLERTGTPFSWSAMAAGTFDSRLRADMQKLKSGWSGRQGVLYYRFQHEFNGDWYRWTVDEGNRDQMIAGWRRMAGIFRSVFGNDPRFRIAWSANAGSTPKRFRDIRSAWPGDAFVDVVSLDYYDFFKPGSLGAFASHARSLDDGGGPNGIAAWQRFAAQHGKPWSVSEWGNQYGDNPAYVQGMYDFFAKHAYSGAGSDAGKLIYEVYFNQTFPGASTAGGGEFRVEVDGRDAGFRPNAARRYRELFGA